MRITATFHLNIRASLAASVHHSPLISKWVSFDQPLRKPGVPSRATYVIVMWYHSFSRKPFDETGCHCNVMIALGPFEYTVAFAGEVSGGAL